jgi:hypothetical protein
MSISVVATGFVVEGPSNCSGTKPRVVFVLDPFPGLPGVPGGARLRGRVSRTGPGAMGPRAMSVRPATLSMGSPESDSSQATRPTR